MKFIKKIAVAGLVLMISGIILASIASAVSNRSLFEVVSASNNIETNNTYKDKEIKKVKLKFDVGSINIYKSESNNIEYNYYGNSRIDFTESLNDKTLELKSSTNFAFGILNTRSKLNVYLPKDKLIDLEIDSDVSEVRIDHITVENLNISSNVGAIKVKNSAINNVLNVKSSVGSVLISDVKEPKVVTVKSDVGSIDIYNLYSKTIDLSSDVGAIKFVNDDKTYKVTNFQIETSLGSKKIDIGE